MMAEVCLCSAAVAHGCFSEQFHVPLAAALAGQVSFSMLLQKE
jgi:hypothetical protein